jgi:outer membrane protein assembly factor BamB
MSSGETLWDSGVIPFDVDDYQIDFERGTVQFHSAPSEGGSMIALADLGDGKVLWTTEIPFRRSSRLEPGWVDFQDRSFDQLLIWGADDKGESATVGAIDRLTGSLLWQSQDQDLVGRMLGMGLYDVFVYSDSIAIGMRSDIPGDAGPLWALNLRTGRVEWESTERLTREVLDSWAWDDGGLFIRVDEALWAFNLSDGSTRWTRSDYGRHSVDLRVTERGLLVTCGFGKCSGEKDVILVDPATGDDHFRMETRDPILLANILGDDLFLFAEQRAYRVNLGDGTVEQGTEFEFRDGEQPTGLRPIAGGFLLYSPQNIVGVRVDGSVLFQRHYRAPGASFWSKVGRSIAEATLNSVITRVAQGQAESRARQNARLSALSGGSGEGIGVAYAPLLDLTMTPRIEALEAAADETYFYTRDPDAAGREGFSLVRLLSDGTEGGRIWINERSPDFSFDAASRRVFLKSDRKRIVALGFNPG